jgi:hypothetical protein
MKSKIIDMIANKDFTRLMDDGFSVAGISIATIIMIIEFKKSQNDDSHPPYHPNAVPNDFLSFIQSPPMSDSLTDNSFKGP